MTRMSPAQRRETIVTAALRVMREKGLGATTVRDVAERMGSSSGLIHHYFASMDDLLAAAFERAAATDLTALGAAMQHGRTAVEKLRIFFAGYIRSEQDWAFQLWLDAWAEAARRPAVRETSQRLNIAWQHLLVETIAQGLREGSLTCADPESAAWRILSLLDGLALQTVAHKTSIHREDVAGWSAAHAEHELGLPAGSLNPGRPVDEAAPDQRRPYWLASGQTNGSE